MSENKTSLHSFEIFLFAVFTIIWLIAVITIPIQNRKAAALQEMKIISNQIEEGEAE